MVEFAKKVNYVWEQRKVSELCSISTGKSNTQDKSEDGEYPFYVRSPIIERSTKYLYDEEAVITVGDGVGTGKVFHYVNGKYDLHQRCYRMYGFSDELNVHYFYHTFSKLFYKRVMAMTAKTSVDSVRLEMIADMEIPTPTIEEQIKIGTYFDQLDHLITLHHRECVILRKMKVNDWEQRKFSELYAKSSEKNDGSIGMDKNITVATMQFKENVKVSTAEYLKTYYTFNLGDIAFEGHQSKEFRYGRFVENDIGNGIVSHIFAVFRPIREYDLYFWKYAINNETLMQRILSRSTKASTMMHDLVTKDFLNEMFLVPSFDEQRQIGVFLATLDHLITLHQHKCDELQNLKKYMLQNMFV